MKNTQGLFSKKIQQKAYKMVVFGFLKYNFGKIILFNNGIRTNLEMVWPQ